MRGQVIAEGVKGMTNEEALKKLDELCAKYNVDDVRKVFWSILVSGDCEPENVLHFIECELKKHG